MDEYKSHVESNGYVYFNISCGIYSPKEAGIIALEQLANKLAPYGYEPMNYTPGIWHHKASKTTFDLYLDGPGIK